MKNSLLAGVTVEKPATLILKNVNQSYDGMYKFILTAGDDSGVSEVTVIIAVQATITISCSSITTVNKGDDIICLCKGEGGKPPANVTWYDKDGQIGETGNENQTLILRNVNGTYNGTYTCKAQSHTLTAEKSIEVRVRPDIKPTITSFTTNPSKAMVGQPVTIICVAIGRPEPSYTIIHNGTRIVSTVNIYAISRAEWNDTGTYTCNATNALGNDLEFLNLTV
ncbi:fasciclin-2 isoform X7, partial [Paramuricea clavata]